MRSIIAGQNQPYTNVPGRSLLSNCCHHRQHLAPCYEGGAEKKKRRGENKEVMRFYLFISYRFVG